MHIVETRAPRSATFSRNMTLTRALFIKFFVLFLLGAMATVVGTREPWVGTDTYAYIDFFDRAKICNCRPDTAEILFGKLAEVTVHLDGSYKAFLISISAIQLALAFKVGSTLGKHLEYGNKEQIYTLLFISLLFVSPFFMAAQINVLRQGISALFAILAAVALREKRWWLFLLWGALGTGFHYSTLMYLAVMPLLLVSHNKRNGIFIILVLGYALGISENVVRWFSQSTGLPIYIYIADYATGYDYRTGVRLDFLLFSLLPLAFARFSIFTGKTILFRQRLDALTSIYGVLLIPFLLFGWAVFSDRYALTAWILLPAFCAYFGSRFISKNHWLVAVGLTLGGAVWFTMAIPK